MPMTAVDEDHAKSRGFKISQSSEGKKFLSPCGPVLLISKCTSEEAATLNWTFRVDGNSSWSVGLISDEAKGENDELFHRGKVGLDSSGLCGGAMSEVSMHMKRVEVIYEAKSRTATFRIEGISNEIKQKNEMKSAVRLALSTFNGSSVVFLTSGPCAATSIQAGTRVQVKPSISKPRYNWGSISHSDIGTVISVDSDGDVLVDFASQSRWMGRLDELQAVSPSSTPSETTVNVGDKLRVISSAAAAEKACEGCGGWCSDMSKSLGKLLTVTHVMSDRVRLDGDGSSWVWGWAAVQFDAGSGGGGGGGGDTFKVGDRIVLARGYKGCSDAAGGPLKPKETGTIIEVYSSACAK
jgi:hypothetical protein